MSVKNGEMYSKLGLGLSLSLSHPQTLTHTRTHHFDILVLVDGLVRQAEVELHRHRGGSRCLRGKPVDRTTSRVAEHHTVRRDT